MLTSKIAKLKNSIIKMSAKTLSFEGERETTLLSDLGTTIEPLVKMTILQQHSSSPEDWRRHQIKTHMKAGWEKSFINPTWKHDPLVTLEDSWIVDDVRPRSEGRVESSEMKDKAVMLETLFINQAGRSLLGSDWDKRFWQIWTPQDRYPK